jgi:hypothetical protein
MSPQQLQEYVRDEEAIAKIGRRAREERQQKARDTFNYGDCELCDGLPTLQ